jgi:predicted ATP-grasp superfamily ATP-dependent carboligase
VRKGADVDGDEDNDDKDSMNNRSPIQRIQGDDPSDEEDTTSDQGDEMSKPTSKTLHQVKILLAGNSNLDLSSWTQDIEYFRGSVTSNLEEADVAVVLNQESAHEIQYLKKKAGETIYESGRSPESVEWRSLPR